MLTQDPPDGRPDAPAQAWVRLATVLITAVALPVVLVLLVVWKSPEFSVLDEPAHADYLRRIEQGELPRVGDTVLDQTVEDVQCRTVQGHAAPRCGVPSDKRDFMTAGGYQYEAQQPPLYYWITAQLRRLTSLSPSDDFVTTARMTGAIWLSAGLLVFWWAARRLRCPWWPTAIVVSLLALSPGALYQSATINNDAAAILTGSTALLMVAMLRDRIRVPSVALWSAIAVAIVLVKPTGVIAVAAATAALLVDGWADRRLRWRGALARVIPLVAGLVAYVGWGVVRDARETVDYDVVLKALLGFKMTDDYPLNNVVAYVSRLPNAYAGGSLPIAPTFVGGPAAVVTWLLIAAALVPLVAPRGGVVAQRTGIVALLALVLGGPAFTVLFYADYSIYGGPALRYGLSLLPLLAVAAAATYRTRRAMAAMGTFGVLLAGSLLIATLYPTTRGG